MVENIYWVKRHERSKEVDEKSGFVPVQVVISMLDMDSYTFVFKNKFFGKM